MTFSEIANKVTDLRNMYNLETAKWHVSVTEDKYGVEVNFFVDINTETREVRKSIKKLFGEPTETMLWEKEDYDYITYKYENRY